MVFQSPTGATRTETRGYAADLGPNPGISTQFTPHLTKPGDIWWCFRAPRVQHKQKPGDMRPIWVQTRGYPPNLHQTRGYPPHLYQTRGYPNTTLFFLETSFCVALRALFVVVC